MNDMNWVHLAKKPTMSIKDTIAEVKLLTGCDGEWKSLKEVYNYDPDNTTLKQMTNMKNTLKQRQQEASFNLVRYIYLFWKRMLDWGSDAVVTAQQFIHGFDVVETPKQVSQTLVRSEDKPAFPWHWSEAEWKIEADGIYRVPEYGKQEILKCYVTCYVRDHEEEWAFAIPIMFLDPEYDFKSDKVFMDFYDQIRYSVIYRSLFGLNNMENLREIIKLLPKAIVESILKINGRKIPEGYYDLLNKD